MKRCGQILICGLAGIGFTLGSMTLAADRQGGPYYGIVDRNVFRLVPSASLGTARPPTPVILRPKTVLRGITTILGRKLAFLMMPASKSGGVPEWLLLGEGQAQDEIKVTEINEKNGVVRIINHGVEQTLDFDHNDNEPSDIPPSRIDPPKIIFMQESPLTPEQQTLLIESQRLKAMQDGDPVASILPPTEFTAEVTGEAP